MRGARIESPAVCLVRYYFDEYKKPRPKLEEEMAEANGLIQRLVKVDLEKHQRQALISLLSDLVGGHATGTTSFEKSTLLTELNAKHYQLAAGEFFAFTHRGSRVDPILWRKRCAEQILFRSGKLKMQ